MANRVPHGKVPIGAGRGKMNFKVLNRLMKQVFSDYPVHLTIVLICIVLSLVLRRQRILKRSPAILKRA